LIMVSWHVNNPVTGELWDNTYVDFNELITEGSVLNTIYKAEMDRIASGFQQFENNNIPTLFRPLHELNGGWFWWGNKDPEQFKNVWRYTFNYLTQTKGLHNLLWIYNLNANSGNYLAYYPGDNYVDIVGLDYYGDGNLPKLEGYSELITLGKPFSINEFGSCGPKAAVNGPGCDTPEDGTLIIQGIKANMPKTVFWQNWGSIWRLANNYNLKQLLEDPWVVNRGEIVNLTTNTIWNTFAEINKRVSNNLANALTAFWSALGIFFIGVFGN